MIDNIFDWSLLIKASLIDSLLRKAWFDDIELAQMSSAFTIFTDAIFLIMMGEVIAFQLFSSSYEKLMLSIDFFLAFFIVGVLGFEAGEILA